MKKFFTCFVLLSIFGLSSVFAQEKIFFTAQPNGSSYQTIWSMNPDGTGRVQLFNDSYHRYGCKISNDKTHIFYIKGKTANEGFIGDSIWVCKASIDGTSEQKIWLYPNFSSFGLRPNFSLSANEQKLVYITDEGGNRDGDVFELDLNTFISINLTNDNDYVEGDVVYQPNSDSIVYTKNGTPWYADPFPMYKMKNDGSGNHLFLPMGNGHYYRPNFSNGGAKLIFSYVPNVGGTFNLYISNSNGSSPVQIIPSSGSSTNLLYSSFSPSNQNICFVRNYVQIITTDLNGSIISTYDTLGHGSISDVIWTVINSTQSIQATITIPDTIQNVSQTVEVPVNTTILNTSDNAISYQFNLAYDNTKLQYSNYSITGTIAQGGTVTVNNNTVGQLQISYMTSTPLSGTGAILKLQFNPLQMGSSNLTITNFFYNTDTITSIDNGIVTIIGEYGDVDANTHIQAYDAALTLQYSVGLDPLPVIDPLPWENWRKIVANVDGVDTVTANDASLILQYSAGLITTFPVQGSKSLESLSDVFISQVNNELVFTTTGNLFGLNILATSTPNIVLGNPQMLNTSMLSAKNISANNYRIGLCSAYPVAENSEIVRIPFTSTDNGTITFNMIVNKEHVTKSIEIVNEATGINKNNLNAVNIFPNPSNGKIYINSSNPVTIKVFNILGEQIISTDNSKINFISLSEKGIYLFELSTEKNTTYKKVVVQ